jgi:hypothetical protein
MVSGSWVNEEKYEAAEHSTLDSACKKLFRASADETIQKCGQFHTEWRTVAHIFCRCTFDSQPHSPGSQPAKT